MDRVHLIKRVSGGGIKTWVENFQNDAHSRIESIFTEDNIHKNDNIGKICEK